MSSLASILWHDFFQLIPYFQKFDDNKSVKTTKLLVLFCGMISTLLAFLISSIGGNLIQVSLGLNGALNAPIVGLFILGSCLSVVNSKGAISGTAVGFLVGLWISFGPRPIYPKLEVEFTEYCKYENMSSKFIYENYFEKSVIESNKFNSSFFFSGKRATNLEGFNTIYSMGYMWFSAFGASVTILVGILVSLFTKGLSTSHEVDKQLLIFDFNSIFKSKNKKKEVNFQINCSYERDEAINYF